VTVFCPKFKQ